MYRKALYLNMIANETERNRLRRLENKSKTKGVTQVKPNLNVSNRSGHYWLISRPFDWISTPIYLACCGSLLYFTEQPGVTRSEILWWQTIMVVAATLILLGLDRYEYFFWGEQIPFRAAISCLVGRAGLVQLITMVNPNEISFFLYLVIPFAALIYFGNRVAVGVGIIVCLLLAGRVLFFPSSGFVIFRPWLFINLFILCLILIMTTANTLQREKASRARAEQLLRQLEQSQLQVEELAATRERNRLARDIHDSLGHYLTVISVQLGKARAFKDRSPAESEQALEDARRLTNEALQDVRESVKSLRTSQELFSLQRSLPILVANSQNEQLTIDLEVSGNEADFSKQSLMVLYRVTQEGLTNVQRHARASWAKVTLKFTIRKVQLTIEDNGKGFDLQNIPANRNGGYGLCGLQERLEMIGGEFCVESQPGNGTRLTASIVENP